MIATIFNGGALPVLERLVQFTSRRQAILADNIANGSTPYFKPRDVDSSAFQYALGRAIDQRRHSASPQSAPLDINDTKHLRFRPGGLDLRPEPVNKEILFDDQNNRDLERMMQDLAENTLAFNFGIEMTRHETGMLETAIRETL